jgi:hypothetical protein
MLDYDLFIFDFNYVVLDTTLIVGIMTIAIQIFTTKQVNATIEKIKSDINKDKIDRVLQIAAMNREYNEMHIVLFDKLKSFLKNTKSKLKREEIDRYYFDTLLLKLQEITLVNDFFYSEDIIKRNDFIESIVNPFLHLSLKCFSYINSEEVLKSTKSDKTEIQRIDILPIIRFIETTKNKKGYNEKIIEEAETIYKQILVV